MSEPIPRLRIFAGPNGSGKSTLFRHIGTILSSQQLGVCINPDDIEKSVADPAGLNLGLFGIKVEEEELRRFFAGSALLQRLPVGEREGGFEYRNGILHSSGHGFSSYHASVLSDFLRRKLLQCKIPVSSETVMSAQDKIELLKQAQAAGYRTYLYYIATESAEINVSRVHNRVQMGGHAVAEDKIRSRYERSLNNLREAVRHTNRAYVFDNSGANQNHVWLAEITDGFSLEIKSDRLPKWFCKVFNLPV